MIRNKDILNSLPMLASVLGDQYGVKVRIGGKDAKTDGRTIYLPEIPLDCDVETLAIVRGFLDHEAAHIRHTDFQAIKNAAMDSITFNFFNAIEDWRIERKLAEIFPGCGQNLRWLIKRIFLEKVEKGTERAGEKSPALSVLNYVLLTVRSWEVPELSERVKELRGEIERIFPLLLPSIDRILANTRKDCHDSIAAILYAHQISDCLRNWKTPYDSISGEKEQKETSKQEELTHSRSISNLDNENENNEEVQSQIDTDQSINTNSENPKPKPENLKNDDGYNSSCASEPEKEDSLKSLFSLKQEELPQGLGELLGSTLSNLAIAHKDSDDTFRMAIKVNKAVAELDDSEISEAMTSSIALRTRLSCLLQSQIQRRIIPGRYGKLNTGTLYRLKLGNPKVFRREAGQRGLNTAIHILLDASGSMHGKPIRLALNACYAIGKALENQQGISVGITAFPAYSPDTIGVYSLLPQGGRLTRSMRVSASGDTPLGASLYWVMNKLYKCREERKILLILTDGYPSDWNLTQRALKEVENIGIEVYGLGLISNSLTELLPGKSRIISEIQELVPAMFDLLGKSIKMGREE